MAICFSNWDLPHTSSALRRSQFSKKRVSGRGVKNETREILIGRMERGEPSLAGILGFDDSVVPQFILVGLKRLIRLLTTLSDPPPPYVAQGRYQMNSSAVC